MKIDINKYNLPERRPEPYKLSKRSQERLAGIDPRLQALVRQILFYIDITVIEGLRSVATQKYYCSIGVSKTMNSKHLLGKAVDLYPYPVPRKADGTIDSDADAWDRLGAVAIILASKMGIPIQWGGLWTTLVDKPHFEIKEK